MGDPPPPSTATSSITKSTSPLDVSPRVYPGMLPSQMLVSMTARINSGSLQPPRGGGDDGDDDHTLESPNQPSFGIDTGDGVTMNPHLCEHGDGTNQDHVTDGRTAGKF